MAKRTGRTIRPLDAAVVKPRAAAQTLRCRTVATGRLFPLNYIRHLPPHRPIEDEPESLASGNTAPNPSEALLAALGSCLAASIHANAIARHISIGRLELHLDGDIYPSAALRPGEPNPPPIGFDAIRVVVQLEADATQEALAAIVQHATLWSPVSNTLHNPVHLDVMLAARQGGS